jgi:hypothetical protein
MMGHTVNLVTKITELCRVRPISLTKNILKDLLNLILTSVSKSLVSSRDAKRKVTTPATHAVINKVATKHALDLRTALVSFAASSSCCSLLKVLLPVPVLDEWSADVVEL